MPFMKILYAIQGTGNGHLSRARDIVPILQTRGELDVLVSGTQADIPLDYPIKYKFGGLSFIFGKKGGIDLKQTFIRTDSRRLYREIHDFPIEQYDLIFSDFEPVSAWAARMKRKPCIALSHQCAVMAEEAPKPKKEDSVGKFILKNYAPASICYGFHFARYAPNIFTPVIRKQVREAEVISGGHYTVYLPAYDDGRLYNILSGVKNARWEIFSKHNQGEFTFGNVSIRRLNNEAFIESMAGSQGVLCGAGFETPAEALFLKKKLMVIPMKNQYEQQCNAAALKQMGVPVLKKLHAKYTGELIDWVDSGRIIPVDYPDETVQIIDTIIAKHAPGANAANYQWSTSVSG
jgi:uncharacterized protein (TIGR00661 family)